MAEKENEISDKGSGVEKARKIFEELLQDNAKYLAGESLPQSEISSPALRSELATNGQKPVAAVVACADSRVSPEIVFGAGLGRLFVVRNAGNVVWGDSVEGSLEYAVSYLGVGLVIVMGHSKCGAVGAAVGGMDGEGPLSWHVKRIGEGLMGVEDVQKGVEKNVKDGVMRLLGGETAVARLARESNVLVLGAMYDIDSGEVKEVVIEDCETMRIS